MSKHLTILLTDSELCEIQRSAQRERLTIDEWIRQALRNAFASRPAINSETKLKAVRRAMQYSFPTADIDQMLSEIGRA